MQILPSHFLLAPDTYFREMSDPGLSLHKNFIPRSVGIAISRIDVLFICHIPQKVFVLVFWLERRFWLQRCSSGQFIHLQIEPEFTQPLDRRWELHRILYPYYRCIAPMTGLNFLWASLCILVLPSTFFEFFSFSIIVEEKHLTLHIDRHQDLKYNFHCKA